MIQSLNTTTAALSAAAGKDTSPAAGDARRLATTLQRLASAAPAVRVNAGAALTQPLGVLLGQIRESLKAEPVSFAHPAAGAEIRLGGQGRPPPASRSSPRATATTTQC